jgi:3-isopropylmalate dehydrogenase
MVRYSLGRDDVACRIEKAVEKTLDDGFRCGDIFEDGKTKVGTKEMTEKVLERL